MLGRFDNAIKYLEKSILHNVNKHDFMNLGHIYWCKGDKLKAIQNYRLSMKSSGQNVDWFSRVMHDDSKYLAKYHIHAIDIPLMIDYIRLSATL